MKVNTGFFLFVNLILWNKSLFSQEQNVHSKNTFEFGMLGNKGFGFIGYNRALFQSKKIEPL